MTDDAHAFWRRLDRPGHDVARLQRVPPGWVLDGYAVFHEDGATGLHYRVELADDFATVCAEIQGQRSGAQVLHRFARTEGGWTLDGRAAPGLDDLIHLDFGFTPATNLQQLRHARLAIGDEADIVAAWFDIGEAGLVRLPQRYRRLDGHRYRYSSPTAAYEAVLELAPNGFVRLYPELWQMEPLHG